MNPVTRAVRRAMKPVVIQTLLTWERMESGVSFNPTSAGTRENPYDNYAELRREGSRPSYAVAERVGR